MTQSIEALERDIEESRARLDVTIDRLQDRLSVSGIVDDMMGSVRRTQYGTAMDRALAAIRENPVPVLLVVAGLGWLIHRVNAQSRAGLATSYGVYEFDGDAALRTRVDRGYDLDPTSPRPNPDILEPRSTLDTARA